ncbi:hypothetical protein D1816_10480 [Aquimarina sp. AD10]|uniref:Uncharacterized protein n=1 Tax=Aquimarina aggregata TaxID=1642818 RepID=A0A162CRW4_9FLAO|nr:MULTISPECIES: hypothetical protein [Aquimarina]AXT60756.1 hypothetical protein D1816_10480 [Aquimarina sp. AD10]KZS41244.1 hypothetical protein AWE51_22835 [Aquimarina aggregata]RKM98545.1 hypothetical protein D7033_12815 [Aquimarina sp. AD10]
MKSRIFQTALALVLILSCQKEKKQNPFEISINRIGLLTNEIPINKLDSIFANDSIAKSSPDNKLLGTTNEIEIYEKGGAKLLVLEPKKDTDVSSTIGNIQVIDPRYKTASGLSSNSTFKDIKEQYNVSKINNTLSTAVIFVDSLQAYFTIDKKELPEKFKFNTDSKIEISDIPDTARIKHFWLQWE